MFSGIDISLSTTCTNKKKNIKKLKATLNVFVNKYMISMTIFLPRKYYIETVLNNTLSHISALRIPISYWNITVLRIYL